VKCRPRRCSFCSTHSSRKVCDDHGRATSRRGCRTRPLSNTARSLPSPAAPCASQAEASFATRWTAPSIGHRMHWSARDLVDGHRRDRLQSEMRRTR
jgi:hypothetical protein